MLRGLIKLAAWAAVTWLVFFVPVEGRSWARHMQEIWLLPGVQAKRQLLQRQMVGAACRLRDALPPSAGVGPGHRGRAPQEQLGSGDRQALDRLLEDAQAAPPADRPPPTRRR